MKTVDERAVAQAMVDLGGSGWSKVAVITVVSPWEEPWESSRNPLRSDQFFKEESREDHSSTLSE